MKITPRVSPFSRKVIFTRAPVSLALIFLRKNGDCLSSRFGIIQVLAPFSLKKNLLQEILIRRSIK